MEKSREVLVILLCGLFSEALCGKFVLLGRTRCKQMS